MAGQSAPRLWLGSTNMPFALALVASAFLHIATLLGPAWDMPTLDDEEHPPRLDAILMPAAPHTASVAIRPHVATTPTAPAPPKPPHAKPRSRALEIPPPTKVTESNLPVETAAAVLPAPTFNEPTSEELTPDEPAVVEPAPPSAVPVSLPDKGRMRFIVTRGESGLIIGQAINTWTHDGIHYTFTNITETTGLAALFNSARVIQESQGEITPQGLRPLFFSNDNERKGKKDTATFDWTAHLVTYADRTEPVADGTQDMLSMYYQLVLQVAMNQTMQAIDLSIATGRKLERYHFELIGEETLTYQGSPHATQHLRTKNGNDTIDIWIAKTVSGMPLKIRFTDRKGGIFDQIADDANTEHTHE